MSFSEAEFVARFQTVVDSILAGERGQRWVHPLHEPLCGWLVECAELAILAGRGRESLRTYRSAAL